MGEHISVNYSVIGGTVLLQSLIVYVCVQYKGGFWFPYYSNYTFSEIWGNLAYLALELIH